MAFGNYAPFYRSGFFNPMQPMPMQNMQDNGSQFAQPFQQPMQQPQMQMPIQSQSFDDRIWVQGEAGAKAYLVAPNNTVVLWDTERPTIYIKRADATGKPLDMDIIDCTMRTSNTPKMAQEHVCQCGGNYAPIEDFNALKQEFAALSQKVQEMTANTTVKSKKAEVENNG